MKKLNYILILAFALALFACEDLDEKPTLDNENALAPALISPADMSTYTLSAGEATNNFDIFKWSAADYGADIALNYTLQLDLAGGQFTDPERLATTTSLTDTMTNAEINLLLFEMGFTTSVATDFDLRVFCSSPNDAVSTLYSEMNTISITPFEYQASSLTAPANGSTFIFAEDLTGEVDFEEFTWTAVEYYLEAETKYTLQFDHPDNAFSSPVNLYSGSNTDFTPKLLTLNNAILNHGYEVGVAADVDFRVSTAVDGEGKLQSEVVTLTITPYSSEEPPPEPLYLVGSATTAGWDNTAGLVIEWDADRSVHSITTELTTGGMKILKTLGAWAPQWGDDGNGDGTGGVLIYRPDEITTDPAEIPSPGEGTYRIDIDIPNLTYTITAV